MQFDLANILVFIALGAGFLTATPTLGSLLRPSTPNPEKLGIYECGEKPYQQAWFNFNPRFGPEEGALELEFHVKEYGFKMLKLHSNMHNYRPDRALDWLRPAMKMCAKYNVVVLIHTGDGPYSIPTQFYPVIREFPMVNFIIGHFGIQTGGNYSFEAFWMAMERPPMK